MGNGVTIAIARQVIPRDELDLTVRDFFQKAFQDSAEAGLRKIQEKFMILILKLMWC